MRWFVRILCRVRAAWFEALRIQQPRVNSSGNALGNAVKGMRLLPAHSDLDYARFVFNQPAHSFPADTPALREIANAEMIVKSRILGLHSIAFTRAKALQHGRMWGPEVSRVTGRSSP